MNTLLADAAASTNRIRAMIERHAYLLLKSWPRMASMAYYPTVTMIMWAFVTVYLRPTSNFLADAPLSEAAARAAFSVASTKTSEAAACVLRMSSRVAGVNHESRALVSAATFDRSKKRSPFSSSRAGKSNSDVKAGKPIVGATLAASRKSERCNGRPTICRRYGCADFSAACAMLRTYFTSPASPNSLAVSRGKAPRRAARRPSGPSADIPRRSASCGS